MVSRKSQVDKNTKDEKQPRRREKKIDTSKLEDAVQDGKFTGSVGDRLIVVRPRDGRLQQSVCLVKSFDDRYVETFDETREQFYTFPLVGLAEAGVVVKKT